MWGAGCQQGSERSERLETFPRLFALKPLLKTLLVAAFAALSFTSSARAGEPYAAPPPVCQQLSAYRDEVLRYGRAWEAAEQEDAPLDEVCKLMKAFLGADGKMIAILEENGALCAVPSGLIERAKTNHNKMWQLRKQICGVGALSPQPKTAQPKIDTHKTTSGTAFFVTKAGKALTNAHVVKGCREISVTMEGQRVGARILATDERNDLALLATNLHLSRAANWRLKVRQGEDVVVY